MRLADVKIQEVSNQPYVQQLELCCKTTDRLTHFHPERHRGLGVPRFPRASCRQRESELAWCFDFTAAVDKRIGRCGDI